MALKNDTPLNRRLAGTAKTIRVIESTDGVMVLFGVADPQARKDLYQLIQRDLIAGELIIEVSRGS